MISEIPFIFVRTKIDKTASEDKRKFPRTFCERRVVKQVRDRCEESITGAKLPQSKTFVISTVYPDKWDFRALVQGKHFKNVRRLWVTSMLMTNVGAFSC